MKRMNRKEWAENCDVLMGRLVADIAAVLDLLNAGIEQGHVAEPTALLGFIGKLTDVGYEVAKARVAVAMGRGRKDS